MGLIFTAFGKSLAQVMDPRFLRVIVLGIVLALGLLAVVTWGFSEVILLVLPDSFDFPLIGQIGGMGVVLSWGGFLVMMGLSVFLMIPVASAFSGVFLDEVADAVEQRHYAHLPAARGQSLYDGLKSGLNFLGVVVAVNAVGLVFYLISGPFAPLLFWAVNGFLLGREYFALVALRRMDKEPARVMRRAHWGQIWLAGILMAAPLSIPGVNLVIPVLAVATFTHLFHALLPPPLGSPRTP